MCSVSAQVLDIVVHVFSVLCLSCCKTLHAAHTVYCRHMQLSVQEGEESCEDKVLIWHWSQSRGS